jgi:hypothetical protein
MTGQRWKLPVALLRATDGARCNANIEPSSIMVCSLSETGPFLADTHALRVRVAEVGSLDAPRAVHRDLLTYRQEQVDQELAEPDTLWAETDAAQKAEHEWRQEAGQLQAQRLTLARRFGGNQWGRLRTVLKAMTHLTRFSAE